MAFVRNSYCTVVRAGEPVDRDVGARRKADGLVLKVGAGIAAAVAVVVAVIVAAEGGVVAAAKHYWPDSGHVARH